MLGGTRTTTLLIGALVGALLLTSTNGSAQEAAAQVEEEAPPIEEILITATKRTTTQQRTPIALTAITSEAIDRRFAKDLRDIADLAPNLYISHVAGFNAAAIGIRGASTGDIILSFDPAIAVVINDVPMAHIQSQMLDLFDLERIEVLRGPQGTLFGKNTTGGVISVTTKRPTFEFGGEAKVFMETDYGRYGTKFVLNVPLIDEQLAFRFAGSFEKSDGFYKNDKPCSGCLPLLAAAGFGPGEAVGDGGDLAGDDIFLGRAMLLWTPTDTYEALLTYEFMNDDGDSPPSVNETPGNNEADHIGIKRTFLANLIGFEGIGATGTDPFSTGISNRGAPINMGKGHREEVYGIYLNQHLTLGDYTLTSVTGFRDHKDYLPSTYVGEAFESFFDAARDTHREQFSQELRVASDFDGPFNFVAGGFYWENNFDYGAISYLGFLTIAGIDPTANTDAALSYAQQDTTSWALFADGTYEITDRIRLTAGVRQTWEEKEFFRAVGERISAFGLPDTSWNHWRMIVSPAEYDAAPAGFVTDTDEDWSKLTFRAGIDYQYTDDLMTYFMFSRGFKSGGFSSQCTSVATCSPYDEEIADSWEIGVKSMWFEDRLRANLALFWVDYDEIQREQVIAVIDARGNPNQETVTTNAGELRAKGVELELTAAPVRGLEITGSVGYTDVEYEEFLTNFAPANAALIAQGLCADAASCAAAGFNLDALGNDDGTLLDVTRTPEWQLALGATYERNLGRWGDILFNLNAHWQPESEYSTFNHPRTQYEERFLVNGSITFFDVADRFSLSVYGKNLLDEEYRVTGNSVAGLWNMVLYGAPRQIGVELGFRF